MPKPPPRYRQIANELRDLIHRDLGPGEQIPSRAELAERYGCADKTVAHAIAVLEGEGLVESRQGSGVFVRRRNPLVVRYANERYKHDESLGTRFFTAEANRQGHRGDQKLLGVEHVIPPPQIAMRLLAEEDEQVLCRRHLLLADDIPVALADAYYRLALARGTALEQMARIERGSAELLTDEMGITLGRSREEVRIREATSDERERLQLRDGEWVYDVLVTLYAEDDTPLRVTAWVMSGDRNAIVFDVPV
jgi:GntR family transcriptional regulator